ncbi:hypothetical protein DM860_005020 [Cuscuta australis]|uniref:Uncharacterized protein n=1 Tax=Cuscuta australis TaxID=267555 RepID=A0A328DR81_9ASTE|nr:hypothetical protein DM860_005020 [Cuscuta australis]
MSSISKTRPSSGLPPDYQESITEEKTPPVTNHLYLANSSSALDRDAVLRRIRHHKRMERARRNLQAVFGNPSPPPPPPSAEDTINKWVQLGDVFWSP